jgi:hypothetical protein
MNCLPRRMHALTIFCSWCLGKSLPYLAITASWHPFAASPMSRHTPPPAIPCCWWAISSSRVACVLKQVVNRMMTLEGRNHAAKDPWSGLQAHFECVARTCVARKKAIPSCSVVQAYFQSSGLP